MASPQLAIGYTPTLTPEIVRKQKTKKIRVLNMLRAGGAVGVSNVALNTVTFRYGAYIHVLRTEGHRIQTTCVDGEKGLWKFTYLGANYEPTLFNQ